MSLLCLILCLSIIMSLHNPTRDWAAKAERPGFIKNTVICSFYLFPHSYIPLHDPAVSSLGLPGILSHFYNTIKIPKK